MRRAVRGVDRPDESCFGERVDQFVALRLRVGAKGCQDAGDIGFILPIVDVYGVTAISWKYVHDYVIDGIRFL